MTARQLQQKVLGMRDLVDHALPGLGWVRNPHRSFRGSERIRDRVARRSRNAVSRSGVANFIRERLAGR
jgi:hypothetical protein